MLTADQRKARFDGPQPYIIFGKLSSSIEISPRRLFRPGWGEHWSEQL